MLKNFLLVGLRNLRRNAFYSVINIVGLGTAMAMCVAGYVNYEFSQSFDSLHKNADNIYLVESYWQEQDARQEMLNSPTPLAPALAADIPGVTGYSRVALNFGAVKYGDRVFREALYYVDSNFFEMFDFPAVLGSTDAVHSLDQAVISQEIADRLFGDEQPIGKEISIIFDGEREYRFVVGGVIATAPMNSGLDPDICIRYEKQAEIYDFDLLSWTDWTSGAFIELDGRTPLSLVEGRLNTYVPRSNEVNTKRPVDGFTLVPLRQLAALVQDIGGAFRPGMHPAAIMAPSVAAFLVLLLACFNFMNTSIAFAVRRIKEIGVRKVIGGRRSQLVWQFMCENLLLCMIALVLAAALAEVFVPAYDNLWPEISLSIKYSENLGLVGFLVGLLLFTAVAAGAYPAFYISRFNPVSIFRGKQKLGGTNPLIRILLTMQLALTMTAIIAAAVLMKNADYIENLDLGYDKKDVLVVFIDNEREYQLLKDRIANNPDVLAFGVSRSQMARFFSGMRIKIDQTESTVHVFDIGENFIQTMRMDLVEGRTLDPSLASDLDNGVIVNETFVERFGMTSPIDQSFAYEFSDSMVECRIAGVVRDFHPNGISTVVRPTIMRLATPDQYRYAFIRCRPEKVSDTQAYVEQSWKELFPNSPFVSYWHDETMDESTVNTSIKLVFLYIAGMVAVISSMGLLALVSLNIARRTKEFGIRKALGASMSSIGQLIAREFLILIIIGSVLASVLSYFMLDTFLSSIWIYYCDFGVMPFVWGVLLILGVAVLVTGYRVFTAATANPVDALRYE